MYVRLVRDAGDRSVAQINALIFARRPRDRNRFRARPVGGVSVRGRYGVGAARRVYDRHGIGRGPRRTSAETRGGLCKIPGEET